MTTSKEPDHITQRYDGSIFIVAKMSNPNGDPDLGNMPRHDPVTQLGFITPPCIKRHIRDYVQEVHGLNLWVQSKSILGEATDKVASKAEIKASKPGKSNKLTTEGEDQLAKAMGDEFFDVRAFGGVLANYNTRVTGPVQIGFGISLDPIQIMDNSVTVCAAASKAQNTDKSMGKLPVVSFGVYRADFSVTPSQAKRTGFSKKDMRMVLEGILKGFEHHPSTARSNVYVDRIELFEHSNALGSASKRQLLHSVRATLTKADNVPTDISDYVIEVDIEGLPGIKHYSIRALADLDQIMPL